MSVVFNPMLPPKAGYVEVIDENGKRVYKPTAETKARLQREASTARTQQSLESTVGEMLGSETSAPEPQAAVEFHKVVQLFAMSLTDETQILSIASLYPAYQIGVQYKAKTDDHPADIFSYGTNSVGDPQLYMVLQDHKSAAEFPPDTSTSLYKAIGINEEGIPEWIQPLGATDAYEYGDIVMHNGVKYRSTYEGANVWEPGVFGWEVVSDEPEEPEEPTIPEWKQPTGSHDAYDIGDQVLYNGKVYESLIDGNTYAPDAYPDGWKLVES